MLSHRQGKQANILVDGAGIARVADFGLMTMTDLSTLVLSKTIISSGGTLGWMSPELLDPSRFGSDGCPTRESDCYALGMVIYEVSSFHWRGRQVGVLAHPILGSHWPPTISSHSGLHTHARYHERRTSEKAS